jgi:hypothetical protein
MEVRLNIKANFLKGNNFLFIHFITNLMLLFDVSVPDDLVDGQPIRIGAFIVATFASFILGLLFGIIISLKYPLFVKSQYPENLIIIEDAIEDENEHI